MNLKEEYKTETNKDVYSDECCMRPSASYSDDYVKWLESKLKNNGGLVNGSECTHERTAFQNLRCDVCTNCGEITQVYV